MNYEQTKINYFIISIFGFMIGLVPITIVLAQEPNNQIPTNSHSSIDTTWEYNKVTKWDITIKNTTWTAVKLNNNKWEDNKPKYSWAKEEIKRTVQLPILKTGDKKVLVKWFAINSRANYVSTKAWEYRQETWFLILLRCENAEYDMYRRSDGIWDNGFYDYWICQINKWYHPEIVNTDMFWNSLDYQIEQCYKLWKWWTPFYWPDRKSKKNWKPCKENVKNDFSIIDLSV